MSDGVMDSAQGLFDGSSNATLLPVLLSLRRSRMLLGSPLIARARDSPAELDPEFDSCTELDVMPEVSTCSP